MKLFSQNSYRYQDQLRIEQAICFLSDHYQKDRQNDKPFLFHSLRIAELLRLSNEPPRIYIAAVLHDITEDTACIISEVEEMFGEETAKLVSLNSFNPEIENYEKRYQEQFRRLRSNRDALIIKTADILDNRRFLNLANANMQEKLHQKHSYFMDIANDQLDCHPLFIRLNNQVLCSDSDQDG